MSKAKFHPKLQMIVERHERNKAALFVPNEDVLQHAGQKPLYLPAEQKEQAERVEAAYRDELAKLLEEAERDANDAGITLMRLNNPYRWLGESEATKAAALAPFVKEDFQKAGDVPALLALVRQAGTGDKVGRWLAYRYVTERIEELAKAGAFKGEVNAATIDMRENLTTSVGRLKSSLLSGTDKTAYDAAKQRRREAEEIRDGIKILTMLRG